jgi:putative ABC transport system substrate-binding protein
MRRRDFISLVSSAAAALPLAGRAQQAGRLRHIGVLELDDAPEGQAEIAVLRRGLAEHGWVEGQTIEIAVRWPGADIDLIAAAAKALVTAKPDVLLSRSTPTTTALRKETESIPIVFVNVAAPVEQGLVQSLARPGGNVTGFTTFESSVTSKMLQLLKNVDPRIGRVSVVYNPETAPFAELYLSPLEAASASLGVETTVVPVRSGPDIETAMGALAKQAGGLLALPDSFLNVHHELIIGLAASMHVPAIYGINSARNGGLMTYTPDPLDMMHRAADYIDRILRGARPTELPVQQPTKFELTINLKAAKALGLTVPDTLLALADQVIE